MSIVQEYYKEVLNRKIFYIPLLIFSIIGYGFSLFNRTIGWDDLLRDHYFGDIALAGRWGEALWTKLLGIQDFDPFIDRFVALLFLIIASILFSFLVFSITKRKRAFIYTITSTIFVTYPLINEIWEYSGANLFVTGGLALTTLTLCILRNNKQSIKWVLISSLLLVLPISSYESSIFYYLALICAVVFLDNLYNKAYVNFKSFILGISYYISPVIIAFLIRVLVSLLLRMMFGLSSVGGGQTDINWLTDAPSLVFMKIAGGNFLKYVLAALVYFPITEFFVATLVFIAFIIFLSAKNKTWACLLYGFLLLLSLFSQAILQGTALPYRTAQTLTLFLAFSGFLLCDFIYSEKNKVVNILIYLFALGICWNQAVFMNHVLGLNNLRSENEVHIIRSIGERITRDYDKKPVIFISPYSPGLWVDKRVKIENASWNGRLYNRISDKIIPEEFRKYMSDRVIETNVNCATEEYSQIQAIFSYYGYDIEVIGPTEKPHTPEYLHKDTRLLKEAMEIAYENNMRPYEILDRGEYLIVNLTGKRTYLDEDE